MKPWMHAAPLVIVVSLADSSFPPDPRVKDWLWMQSPLPTLVLIALYVAMVIWGPRIMKNRPAFELKPLLFVFNSAVVALYVYLSKEVIVCHSEILSVG